MTISRKLLIFGGLALAIWGMVYGIWYAVFIEHQTLDRLGSTLATSFMRAAENRLTESQTALADAASRSFVYVRQVDAHGHWIGLGLLLLILGMAFDRVEFVERIRVYLAIALLVGAAIEGDIGLGEIEEGCDLLPRESLDAQKMAVAVSKGGGSAHRRRLIVAASREGKPQRGNGETAP